MPLGVLRKPAPEDALLLLEHLSDAPETREGKAAQDGGHGLVGDEQGGDGDQDSDHQPNPPTLLSQMVLHLDDGRMAEADAEKDGCTGAGISRFMKNTKADPRAVPRKGIINAANTGLMVQRYDNSPATRLRFLGVPC